MLIPLLLLLLPLHLAQKLLPLPSSFLVSQSSPWTYYLLAPPSHPLKAQIIVERTQGNGQFTVAMKQGTVPRELYNNTFEADAFDSTGWNFAAEKQQIAFFAAEQGVYYIGVYYQGGETGVQYRLRANEVEGECPEYCAGGCAGVECLCDRDHFGSDCSRRVAKLNGGQTALSLKPMSWLYLSLSLSRLHSEPKNRLLVASKFPISCYVNYGPNPPSPFDNRVQTSFNETSSKLWVKVEASGVMVSLWNRGDSFAQVDIEVSGEGEE